MTRGLPPPDPRSLRPLSSTEFVETPKKNPGVNPPEKKFLGTPLVSSVLRFRDHTHTHNTRYDSPKQVIGPSQRRDKTHSTHKRKVSMPPLEFEPTFPASERPRTQHVLDRTKTEIGINMAYICINIY
jgi:hypothetical protein